MQYDADGILPEALFNYLARLGWSHGDDEKFSREQLVEWFDLDHVNRAPAQFNPDKLLWLNGEYMKEADDERLAALVAPRLAERGIRIAGPALPRVVALLKDRARTLNELADAAQLFFAPHELDDALLRQHVPGAAVALRAFAERAAAVEWTRAAISVLIKQVIGEHGIKMPQLAVPLRVAVTGRTQTPSIDAVLELIGRDTVLQRLDSALKRAGTGA
jgi:glutamyl-tRNA synthetase